MNALLNWVEWVVVAYSITIIITSSRIMEPLRRRVTQQKLAELLHCPMCTGFWVGGVLGYFWWSITGNALMDAFFGSAVSWMLYGKFVLGVNEPAPPRMPQQVGKKP